MTIVDNLKNLIAMYKVSVTAGDVAGSTLVQRIHEMGLGYSL